MQPKKSLGQNFLQDKEVLNKIIRSADLKSDDNIIEIGPGQGALSAKLKKESGKLIMIEKDRFLAEEMARNFKFPILNFQSISNYPTLKFKKKSVVIIGDILKINLPELIEKNNFKKYKVVANIPYYITSPIIQLFLETKFPPQEMFLMIQKEVAERICATPGQMSILSISVQYYAEPEIIFYVDKKSFYHIPEVDSAVIHITHNMGHKTKKEAEDFFRVVRAGFSAKRKMLANNLANSLHLDKKEVIKKLSEIKIAPNQRAQELSVEDWKKISNLF